MTLDEAIEHLEDLLKNKEFSCESCKEEHEQLLIWLKELKTFKEKNMYTRLHADENGIVGKGVKFERIRRVTGYLVGTLDRFNDGKRAEERDRVKHMHL